MSLLILSIFSLLNTLVLYRFEVCFAGQVSFFVRREVVPVLLGYPREPSSRFLVYAHGCTMFLGACRSHVYMALSAYFAFDLLQSFVCVLFCEAYLFFTEKMVLGTPMMY